jgi:hypothetical protein
MSRVSKRGPLSFALAASIIGMSGCAQYQWQKYGATQNDFNKDSYQCQMEAASAFPTAVVSQQVTSGYTTASTTTCTGTGTAYGSGGSVYGSSNTNCITNPGQRVAPVVMTSDVNQKNRQNAAQSCMLARGYRLVQVK